MPLLGACGGPIEQPAQAEVTAIVRRTLEAARDEAPPPVEWRRDDCGKLPGVREGGVCYAGLYLRGDRALVAWRDSYHASAFAHELLHALQWQRGIDDPEHRRDEWKLVNQANAALVVAGY